MRKKNQEKILKPCLGIFSVMGKCYDLLKRLQNTTYHIIRILFLKWSYFLNVNKQNIKGYISQC